MMSDVNELTIFIYEEPNGFLARCPGLVLEVRAPTYDEAREQLRQLVLEYRQTRPELARMNFRLGDRDAR